MINDPDFGAARRDHVHAFLNGADGADAFVRTCQPDLLLINELGRLVSAAASLKESKRGLAEAILGGGQFDIGTQAGRHLELLVS